MIISNKNDIAVSAEFDTGIFMHFNIMSTKNKNTILESHTDIQDIEQLTFEDFTALEIMIAETVSRFLDMKHRELGLYNGDGQNEV